MPVRDPLKNAGHDSYAVPSRKLERMVHCEGWIERDYAYLLEYDPLVASYQEQPCKITYLFDKKKGLTSPILPFTGVTSNQAWLSANRRQNWEIPKISGSGRRRACGASRSTIRSR